MDAGIALKVWRSAAQRQNANRRCVSSRWSYPQVIQLGNGNSRCVLHEISHCPVELPEGKISFLKCCQRLRFLTLRPLDPFINKVKATLETGFLVVTDTIEKWLDKPPGRATPVRSGFELPAGFMRLASNFFKNLVRVNSWLVLRPKPAKTSSLHESSSHLLQR